MNTHLSIAAPNAEDRTTLVSILNRVPNVVISDCEDATSLDISILVIPPDSSTMLGLIPQILGAASPPRILVAAPTGSTLHARLCLALGASGYMANDFNAETFELAITRILDGKLFFDARTQDNLLTCVAEAESQRGIASQLSKTLWVTLMMHAMGVHPKVGAGILGVKHTTFLKQLHRLRAIFGVTSNFELRKWSQKYLTGQDDTAPMVGGLATA